MGQNVGAEGRRRGAKMLIRAQTEVSGGAVDGAAGGAGQRGATLHNLTDGGIHLVRTGGLLSRAVQRVVQTTEQEEGK